MAVDMFLTIKEPQIKGETQDDEFSSDAALDVLAWSWGVSNSGSTHIGGGSGTGKANFQDMSVTAWLDAAYVELFKSSSLGTHHGEIKLVCRKAGGKKALHFYTVTMKNCIITSVSSGGSGGEERLTMNFSINFESFNQVYKVQNKAGGEAAQIPFGYNIAKHKEE